MAKARLELAVIAHNQPRAVAEQIRLLRKHLTDPFNYTIVDSSTKETAAVELERLARDAGVGYRRSIAHDHDVSLNFAWADVLEPSRSRFLGTLDHDIYPQRKTAIVKLIREAGFYGVGQRHAPTDRQYLWPGFCFLDRQWLAGRPVDFSGIRAETRADDGDTGSNLWPLFADVDWQQMHRPEHGYRPIRKPDELGLQSWGYEVIGDWVHLTNTSRWMAIPNPQEREELLFEMVAGL